MAVPPTLREALTRATAQLDASPGLRADASRDALLLLLHMADMSRAALHADPERRLTPEQQAQYESFIQRRLTSEPVQYITGEQEFYGLNLHVTPAVLIPRPETEHLVESVLSELDPGAPVHILDVGTGSGAIAIALAHHLPDAKITAVDISPAALAVASANAQRHNLTDRIDFLESDLLSALEAAHSPHSSSNNELDRQSPAFTREARREQYEVVVSNPPYVPATDRDTLHAQVRDHEPATALFAGTDGLDVYRRLIPQAEAALKPNGLLALEIGHNQHNAIADLLRDWNTVRFVDDLQQIPRVALARKP